MEAQTYKELHESFMKNNNGSSIVEVFVNIVPTYFTTFLTINLLAITNITHIPGQFLIEFFIIVFAIILNVTVLNVRIWEITSTLLLVSVTAAARQMYKRTHIAPFVQIPAKRPQYIDLVRSTINIITSVCILAVDFKAFPRKLAKTETFGVGLMDVGVGLYVFSNGIVASELKAVNKKLTYAKLSQSVLNCVPLLVLGVSRFFVTKEIGYQQHVSEYGVHWNFFITLALTKLFGTIIMTLLSDALHAKYVAIVLVVIHELCLQLGLAQYALSEQVQRDNLLNANREGLISTLGYVALFFASVYIGAMLKVTDELINSRQLLKKALKLGLLALLLWKILYVCEDMFGVSRRLANMGYIIWILSIGTTMTCLFMLCEIFYHFIAFEKPKNTDSDTSIAGMDKNSYCPIIMSAINYNGLGFFLGANLLTGLINLTFQTLLVDTAGCIFIMTVYMFVLCAITVFLYVNKIKIKMW